MKKYGFEWDSADDSVEELKLVLDAMLSTANIGKKYELSLKEVKR